MTSLFQSWKTEVDLERCKSCVNLDSLGRHDICHHPFTDIDEWWNHPFVRFFVDCNPEMSLQLNHCYESRW